MCDVTNRVPGGALFSACVWLTWVNESHHTHRSSSGTHAHRRNVRDIAAAVRLQAGVKLGCEHMTHTGMIHWSSAYIIRTWMGESELDEEPWVRVDAEAALAKLVFDCRIRADVVMSQALSLIAAAFVVRVEEVWRDNDPVRQGLLAHFEPSPPPSLTPRTHSHSHTHTPKKTPRRPTGRPVRTCWAASATIGCVVCLQSLHAWYSLIHAWYSPPVQNALDSTLSTLPACGAASDVFVLHAGRNVAVRQDRVFVLDGVAAQHSWQRTEHAEGRTGCGRADQAFLLLPDPEAQAHPAPRGHPDCEERPA